MKLWLLTIILSLSCSGFGQMKHKKRDSAGAGTLFLYGGLNRSVYSGSQISFYGDDYNYTLKRVNAADLPDDPDAGLSINQFVGRLGYYYTDRWAISIGVDRLGYGVKPLDGASLSGYFGLGADSNWVGNYSGEPVVLDSNQFIYRSNLNFVRLELMRSFKLVTAGRYDQFAIVANTGLGLGPVFSSNTYRFGQEYTNGATGLAGYGIAVNGSLRFEFFKHVFIQTNLGVGMMHLTHTRTRSDDRNQYARQFFGYGVFDTSLGFLFYLRPKNACDSCPHW